jgi:regulator of protease activity HflC (stomatin/prohibitin superfamily)
MGLFTKTDNSGQTEYRTGRIAGAVATGLGALATVWSSLYVVEQREVGLEVLFGGVNEVNKEPGLYKKWPFVERAITYPLYRQRADVTAQEANLRTKDQMRVEGGIFVDYEIDEQSANIVKIYDDLRGDKDDINDVIKMRAKESAVIAFGEFTSVELTSKISEITDRTKILLQASIDEQGWPFKIKSVISNGVRLSPDSEKKLERVMDQEQEQIVLELRERNADKAKVVYQKEGLALAALYTELTKAGVPSDKANELICLKMSDAAGKVQEPFSHGCFGKTNGSYNVALDPTKYLPQPAAASGPK